MKNNNEKMKSFFENRAIEWFLQNEIRIELGVYHDSGSDITVLFVKTKTCAWDNCINSEWNIKVSFVICLGYGGR